MRRCPKCEAAVREDAALCDRCGTPVSLRGFGVPSAEEEGAPIVDPLLSAFDRDPRVRFCPDCLNEFSPSARRCRRCRGVALEKAPRSAYEERLQRRPIHALGERAAAPPDVPADLVRVHVAADVEEARALEAELGFLGVPSVVGSDSLDPFPDPRPVGVYVRRPDRQAAAYVVSGFRPPDPLDAPPGSEPDGLSRARAYHDCGKYRQALRLLEDLRGDVEAEGVAVEALLLAGRVLSAEQRAAEAARSFPAGSAARGRLLALQGVVQALGHDGRPFARGARPAARATLEQAVALAPRLLFAGKALVEVLDHEGDVRALARELRRLDGVNPNLCGRTGWFRTLWQSAG